jgi:hypothetical protein
VVGLHATERDEGEEDARLFPYLAIQRAADVQDEREELRVDETVKLVLLLGAEGWSLRARVLLREVLAVEFNGIEGEHDPLVIRVAPVEVSLGQELDGAERRVRARAGRQEEARLVEVGQATPPGQRLRVRGGGDLGP